jgi:Lon protease-like protein
MPERLPLFPLDTVLFPKATLSLRIFEERYKTMIGECIDKGAPFGVSLIQEGEEAGAEPPIPFEFGCAAEIKKVTRLDGGEFKLVVEGTRRFHVVEEISRDPYVLAEVKYVDDEVGDISTAEESKDTLRASMSRYANLYYLITSKQLSWEKYFRDPVRLSWYLADLIDLENPDKQDLLEVMDASERLRRECDLLVKENQRLEIFWGEHKFPRN